MVIVTQRVVNCERLVCHTMKKIVNSEKFPSVKYDFLEIKKNLEIAMMYLFLNVERKEFFVINYFAVRLLTCGFV